LPHSNFHPELEISENGSAIQLGGPLDREDDDDHLVGITISAVVTQAPARRNNPADVQQGPTGAGMFELDRDGLGLADSWACPAGTQGGPFREDWAFATAEMLEKGEDGAVERYTWSQWVWLRHP
jgi:hypothetical protein